MILPPLVFPGHYAECHYVECRYAECLYVECHYAECRYVERCYAECRYTNNLAELYAAYRYIECLLFYVNLLALAQW